MGKGITPLISRAPLVSTVCCNGRVFLKPLGILISWQNIMKTTCLWQRHNYGSVEGSREKKKSYQIVCSIYSFVCKKYSFVCTI